MLRTIEAWLQIQVLNSANFIEKHDTSRHFGVSMEVFLQLETLSEQRRSECPSHCTTIINLCCRNKINFIAVFSNKTPQIALNLDYTILQQVCTVSTAH